MMILARILFYRCRAHSRRDHANAWIFNHAPASYRRAVMRLGQYRNYDI